MVIKDHEGTKFESKKALSEHWGIKPYMFNYWCKQGLSVKEAIERCKLDRTLVDPEGKSFRSRRLLCKHWGIAESQFAHWLSKGLSVEESIKMCKRERGVYDHKGVKYDTYLDMCNAWGCTYNLFKNRKTLGWDLESSLTLPAGKTSEAVRVQGVYFASLRDLCRELGLDYARFLILRNKGMTLEECIIATPNAKKYREGIKDHLGFRYDSLDLLCEDYEIPKSVYVRERLEGKTKEVILTSPRN